MENAVAILLIILAVMFCIGIVSGILSLFFTIKKKHPVAAIILSIVCWFGVPIAVKFTIGVIASVPLTILLGVFSVVIIVMSIKNMKK